MTASGSCHNRATRRADQPSLIALLGSDGTGVGVMDVTNLAGIASQFITQDAALNIGVDSNSGGHPVCSDGSDTYKLKDAWNLIGWLG